MDFPVEQKIDRESPIPLHRQLYLVLKGQILGNKLPPEAPILSERDLAQKFSVSRNTAQQAIQSLVREGLIYRVRGKGTFVSIRKRPRTNLVGVIVPSVTASFYSMFIKAIEETTHAHKFTLALANVGDDLVKTEKYGVSLIEQGVDGVIFVPMITDIQQEYLRGRHIAERFTASNVPVVFLDRHVGVGPKGRMPLPWDSVTSDNTDGAHQITGYLISLGHKRIGVIRSPIISSTFERLEGYCHALEEASIDYDEELIQVVATGKDIDPSVETLLGLEDPPTAIFAHCDGIARSVLQSLANRYIEVPEEISVAGFDDLDFAKQLPVPLTTVHQQLAKMGATAAKILIDRILGVPGPLKHVRLPVRLVRRKSCAPPPRKK